MSDMFKIAAAAVLAAVCAMVVRKELPELALLLTVCAGVAILIAGSGALSVITDTAAGMAKTGGLPEGLFTPVLKVVGLSVLTRLGAEVCRDAKENALALTVELAGTVLAALALLPLMSTVLDKIKDLL